MHPYRPEPHFERVRVWTARRCILGLTAFVTPWIPTFIFVANDGPKSGSWYAAITAVFLLFAWNVIGWDYEEERYGAPERGPRHELG